MSEMDDVEFLERIVKNNKDFEAGQIASMIKDMKWKEKKFLLWKKNPERDGGRKENYRLIREIPLQIKTALKECLQAGITGLEDPSTNPETARAPVF